PLESMVNRETEFASATARKEPFAEIFMLSMGVQHAVVVEDRLSVPVGETAKVLIWPLLDAIRNFPSGVAASDIPWQLSSDSPLANGEPATSVRAPVVVLI